MIDRLNAELVLLSVAGGHRWVRETDGANRGEVVDQIIRATGLDPARPPSGLSSIPWCAAFVAYIGRLVLGTTGVTKWPLKPWAGCSSLFSEARDLDLVRAVPSRGAVFLLWSASKRRFHHCGFVGEAVRAVDEIVGWKTIEGNTSPAGSPEGTGVFERERTFGPLDQFIWWWT